MKDFIILLLLMSFHLNTLSLFNSQKKLYCFESDLKGIHEADIETDSQDTFILKKIKRSFFWHLKDPLIGALSTEEKCFQNIFSLAWSFNLFDLAPHEGEGIQIGVFDSFGGHCQFNCKCFAGDCSFFNLEGRFLIDNVLYGCVKEDLNFCSSENCFLSEIIKNHGLITCSIIKQIARKVTILPIVISSSKQSFLDTCQKLTAIDKEKIILNLGLKFEEEFNEHAFIKHQEILEFFKDFEYVVASAGNNSSKKILPYPARFSSVFFSVGSYERNQKDYKVSYFSQFEQKIGPCFLAPGKDIVYSLGYRSNTLYSISSGTSNSSAIISGFLALLLGEFQDKFSSSEIKQVIENSTLKFDGNDWVDKVLYGAIDMRSCLLTLHILFEIKLRIPVKRFKKKFTLLTKATFEVLRNRRSSEEILVLAEKKFFVKNKLGYATNLELVTKEAATFVLDLLGIKHKARLF